MNTPALRPTEQSSSAAPATPHRKTAPGNAGTGNPLFALLLQGAESMAVAPDAAETPTDTQAGAQPDTAEPDTTPDPTALLQAWLVPPSTAPAAPLADPSTAGRTSALTSGVDRNPSAALGLPQGSSPAITDGLPADTIATGVIDGAGAADSPQATLLPSGTHTSPLKTTGDLRQPARMETFWTRTSADMQPPEPILVGTEPTATVMRSERDTRLDKTPTTGGVAEHPAGGTDLSMDGLSTGAGAGADSGTPGGGQQQSGTDMLVWSQAHLKKASLNLQDESGGQLGIDVTLNQGEAALSFHSEDANLRAAIEQGAEAALSDMFKDNGLTLAGLSVGTRQPSEDPGTNAMVAKRRMLVEGQNDGTTAAKPWPHPQGKDPGRALDVYA